MTDLHLALKGEYFDAIKDGAKMFEYRLYTSYWSRRLCGRAYSRIVLTRGYPPAGDADRRLIRPWGGYTITTIQHPHFGPRPVLVFAIPVN